MFLCHVGVCRRSRYFWEGTETLPLGIWVVCDPLETCLTSSGQIVGERDGTAYPFRFWRGNAVPLAYTMTTQATEKCALDA